MSSWFDELLGAYEGARRGPPLSPISGIVSARRFAALRKLESGKVNAADGLPSMLSGSGRPLASNACSASHGAVCSAQTTLAWR